MRVILHILVIILNNLLNFFKFLLFDSDSSIGYRNSEPLRGIAILS